MTTPTNDQLNTLKPTVGDDAKILPENINTDVLFFNDRAVGVTLPNCIEQAITETEPGFKGDTSTGASKPAKIGTGAQINVPLFINVGDVVKIDTRTGEYIERLSRA